MCMSLFLRAADGNSIRLKRWAKVKKINQPGYNVLYNSYYLEIKPILIMHRLFGRFPYVMCEHGVKPFSPWSIPAIYTYLYYAVTSAYAIILIRNIVTENIPNSKTYDQALFNLELIMFQIHHLIDPIAYYFGSKEYLEYLHLWATYEKLQGKYRVNKRLQRIVTVWAWGSVPFIATAVYLSAKFVAKIPLYISASIVPVITTMNNCSIFWVATQYKIKEGVRALYLDMRLSGLKSDLEQKRQIWLCLSQLTSQIGNIFSFGMIFTFLTDFFCFVVSSYGFVCNLLLNPESNPLALWGHLFAASFVISFQYFFSATAHSTTQSVGEEFCLNVLSMDLSNLSNRSMDEMLCLLRTIMNNPPIVNLAGFAVVNKTRVVSFYSNMLTYLVVLIQFAASATDLKGTSFVNDSISLAYNKNY